MASEERIPSPKDFQVSRCIDWLQKQNSQMKKSLRNKNDIQFIIQMNADRKKFLLNADEDDATVPAGIGECDAEPKAVPVRSLKTKGLRLECDWPTCRKVVSEYDKFEKHVRGHHKDVHVIKNNESVEYVCLWDICGFKSYDFNEIVRHLNYHAYHAKLLAIGFNGRATLNLLSCNRDSTKRSQLPVFRCDHLCMWSDCEEKFNSFQTFLDHVKLHVLYTERVLCSWAGCGAAFTQRSILIAHVRSHTGEKLIGCYHCGQHFANNRKLLDHVRRQNVNPNSPYQCTMCGLRCATEYLLNEHTRRHVSLFACALCDMTAQSRAALASHVRYRHLSGDDTRVHSCTQCAYRAITKSDLKKHILTHNRKRKKQQKSADLSDDSDTEVVKIVKIKKQYACHLCPEKEMKVFCRGSLLTTHLVKKHGAQWPFGYSRFRYQMSEDGKYRLTTTRYEVLEVSKKIVDGNTGPKVPLDKKLDFTIKQTAVATDSSPRKYEVVYNDGAIIKLSEDAPKPDDQKVEITMCDVDEKGNIIKTEIINEIVIEK